MTTEQWKDIIMHSLEEKQGQHINSIDVHSIFPLADYFIVASANSKRHLWSLSETIEILCKKNRIKSKVQGKEDTSSWVVISANGVFVHLFLAEGREYYKLDELWATQPNVNDNVEPVN